MTDFGDVPPRVRHGALFSVAFPFDKWVACARCEASYPLLVDDPSWRFNRDGSGDYIGLCAAGCTGERVRLVPEDRYARNTIAGLGLIRWPLYSIDAAAHPFEPGRVDFYFRPPRNMRGKLAAGDKPLACSLPVEMVEAALRGRRVKLSSANVFTQEQVVAFARVLLAKASEEPPVGVQTRSSRVVERLAADPSWWWSQLELDAEEDYGAPGTEPAPTEGEEARARSSAEGKDPEAEAPPREV